MDDPRTALRRRMAERRRTLGPQERMRAAQELRRQLDALPALVDAPRVAGYWACDGELPLNLVLAAAALRGQSLYLPRIESGRRMGFAPWKLGDEVEPNRFGIPEPTTREGMLEGRELDAVLVPLLAFDPRGHRLGYGGGFYDAHFAFLRDQPRPARPLLIGIGYAFQQCDAITPAEWDVRLDIVATDQALIDCNDHHGTS
ncbi:5-formyltetrahydrofolate cyclo-ligase [Oleiagrimonas soli]|uniref:5-formyltetrahydrofolate cyclo-ligase n=1 Tax=Oleiagrimonas soli TaxID=1543381 RepID=A0A099CSL1_9GAMM|nr:5-formyltetrahydrofolate cyclo-ligase [Oleiagrimonas soli]KGI76973.1 5-formyltetrahydrofolate cyclo-ligase [Oleiagrimonas soli]